MSFRVISYMERLSETVWVLNGKLGYRVYIGYTKLEVKHLYKSEYEEWELMYGCRMAGNGKRFYC